MIKKVSKLAVAGILTVSLIGGFGEESKKAEAATYYPTEVKVNYVKGYSSTYQSEVKQPYVDLGNKKGTLVFKMYPIFEGIWSTNIWLSARNHTSVGYFLMNKASAIETNANGLYAFNLYDSWKKTGQKTIRKYESGMANAGVAPNGRNYIGLAVYLPKVQNGGKYYLDHAGMSEGSWEIKAYFYENVDLEDALFTQVDKLFPLVGKIMWGKTEVKPGQIGRLTIKQPIELLKESNGSFIQERTLNPGEQYRIYGYRSENGGYYGVGGGYYVKRTPEKALYETPSKAKLRLSEIIYKE